MESTAYKVKEEDTALVVAEAANTSTITTTNADNPMAVTNKIVLTKEMNMTTDVELVVSESAAVSNKSTINVNVTSNSPIAEEDQLNIAMASTTISTNYVHKIKQNQGEAISDDQQKPVTATVTKEIIIDDISMKKESEPDDIINSTIGSRYEDAVEYINNEEEQPQGAVQQKNIPDDESLWQEEEERGDSEVDSDEDSKDVRNNLN